jgi:hypothetical protein
MLVGGEPDTHKHLQLVLHALAADWDNEAQRFQREALILGQAVLALSEHVCVANGFRRFEKVPPLNADAFLPSPARHEQLARALDFSVAELEELCGVRIDVLEPLIHDFGSGPVPDLGEGFSIFERSP